MEYFTADPDSEDEVEERSDDGSRSEEDQEPTVTGMSFLGLFLLLIRPIQVDDGDAGNNTDSGEGRKRPRTKDHTEYSKQWFPWSDKIVCPSSSDLNRMGSQFSEDLHP